MASLKNLRPVFKNKLKASLVDPVALNVEAVYAYTGTTDSSGLIQHTFSTPFERDKIYMHPYFRATVSPYLLPPDITYDENGFSVQVRMWDTANDPSLTLGNPTLVLSSTSDVSGIPVIVFVYVFKETATSV